MKRIGLVFLGALVLFNSCDRSQPLLRKVQTDHLGQLTGTMLNSGKTIGMTGTDLGVSFPDPAHVNQIIFLFGDTLTTAVQPGGPDSTAVASAINVPERLKMPVLAWFQGGLAHPGAFTPVSIPNVRLDAMEVPVEGVVANGKIYIFASTEWGPDPQDPKKRRHLKSALAHTRGTIFEPDQLTLDHVMDSNKFINISAFNEGGTIWIFGSGPYRQSSVYVAKVPESQLGDRSRWVYFQRTFDGVPQFGPDEESAVPIVISNCVGELSVRKHPELGYLMLYNCDRNDGLVPRGIHLRRADHPWGPWDAPISIFDPWRDHGFGHFIHRKIGGGLGEVAYDDGLAEPGLHRHFRDDNCDQDEQIGWRERCWGDPYGPYLVPQWFSRTPDGGYGIVYTLSSFVPYQVHLMRTILAKGDDPKPQPTPTPGQNLPPAKLTNGDFGGVGECTLAGWRSLGDALRIFKGGDGRCRVTTFTVTKGDDATGAIAQEFTVDANTKALRFKVHGGQATVRLQKDFEVLRETRGRSGHEPTNSPETDVCWDISDYAGEVLTIAIFDDKKGPWGFIGATGFEFLKTPCN